MLQWTSQSPDLNLIEMLWKDPKRTGKKQMAENLNDLKQRYKVEWVKIPPPPCERLKQAYWTQLLEVIAA